MAKAAGLPPVNWLGEPLRAFEACIIANVWLGFPFMMVIALGGMQGIPLELYEAARIDRASRWQQFWHITLPLLKPVLLARGYARRHLDVQQSQRDLAGFKRRRAAGLDAHPRLVRLQSGVQFISLRLRGGALDGHVRAAVGVFGVLPAADEGYGKCVRLMRR